MRRRAIMNRRDIFLNNLERLNKIANDMTLSERERIFALCEIYRLYQFDIHNQARTISRIEDIVR